MRQHEGKVGRIVRQDESEGSIDFRSISSEFVHSADSHLSTAPAMKGISIDPRRRERLRWQ